MAGFVAVLILLAFGPMGCGPSGQSTAPTTGEVTITPKANASAPAASASPKDDLAQVPVIKTPQGRRDPFIPVVFKPAAPVAPTTALPEKPVTTKKGPEMKKEPIVNLPTMKVTGIVKMGGTYYASVTGTAASSLTVGDSVDSFKVKSITEKKVVLTKAGRDYDFNLVHSDEQSSQGGKGAEGGGPSGPYGSGGPGAPPPPAPAP